jgi:hypothetical protein
MSKTISQSGTMTISDSSCSSGAGQTQRDLSLGRAGDACSGEKTVEASVCSQVVIDTAGGLGSEFVDIDCLDALSEILYLFLRSSTNVTLRLYALPAVALGVGGTFPTGFSGGETLLITIDGVLVTVTFDAADQSAAQCVARINAAFALAGYSTPLASVVNGQIQISGVATKVGSGGVGELSFGGTGQATLGFASPTNIPAQGEDTTISGLYIAEYPVSGSLAPTKAQISGSATVDIVAGGRS